MRRKILIPVVTAVVLGPVISLGQTANIDNGTVGDGHLDVNIDAYGAYGNWDAAYTDSYQPVGGAAISPTFSAGFRFFSGADRALLTDMPVWNGTLAGGTWVRTITSAISNVNSSTASSSFTLSAFQGPQLSTMLTFDLRQNVVGYGSGAAELFQTYTITNVSGAGLDFSMNRVLDADLIWGGSAFDNDSVKALDGYVIQHDAGNTGESMALNSGTGVAYTSYWGGKNGHMPTGGAPAFAFGSDTVVWANNGLPTTWKNYVAYVGYNIDGDSGLVLGQDAHIGLDWEMSLASGASNTMTVRTMYGNSAVPEPATMIALGAGALALMRRRRSKKSA